MIVFYSGIKVLHADLRFGLFFASFSSNKMGTIAFNWDRCAFGHSETGNTELQSVHHVFFFLYPVLFLFVVSSSSETLRFVHVLPFYILRCA